MPYLKLVWLTTINWLDANRVGMTFSFLFGPAALAFLASLGMAFDVAIAYVLMAHGTPIPYVAAILCTLGIISVYSLSVVGKTISWRIAGAAYATVVCLGIAAGLVARSLV
jgi:hypothetical protein